MNLLVKYILIILFISLSLSLFRNISQASFARTKIQATEANLKKIEDENKKLQKELEIVNSIEYKEKQTRDKLGLAKEGEIVLVLPPEDVLRQLAPVHLQEEAKLPDQNWQKWLKLFL